PPGPIGPAGPTGARNELTLAPFDLGGRGVWTPAGGELAGFRSTGFRCSTRPSGLVPPVSVERANPDVAVVDRAAGIVRLQGNRSRADAAIRCVLTAAVPVGRLHPVHGRGIAHLHHDHFALDRDRLREPLVVLRGWLGDV